jgi:hypothetical protein
LPLPAKRSVSEYCGAGYIGPGEPRGGWDGQCGSPRYPLLVCAGCRHDRSDDRAILDGLKLFRLSWARISTPAQLGSFISRSDPDQDGSVVSTSVPATGISAITHYTGVALQRFDAGMTRYLGRRSVECAESQK